MSYELLKLIHIVNATILVGLGLGSAFYFFVTARGYLAGDSGALMNHVARWVVRGDAWFIAPAVVIQPLTGAWMMVQAQWPWTDWIVASLILYLLAGACWLPVLWLQVRLRELAGCGEPASAQFRRYFHTWTALGVPAFMAMAAVYALMVFKPTYIANIQ